MDEVETRRSQFQADWKKEEEEYLGLKQNEMETENNAFTQIGGSGEEKSQLQADWTKWTRKILASSKMDEVENKNLSLKQNG